MAIAERRPASPTARLATRTGRSVRADSAAASVFYSIGLNGTVTGVVLVLLVPSIAFMLIIERFLNADVVAKIGG
jgi:hypothetical protein